MTTLSASFRRYRLSILLAALSVLAVTALATSAAAWDTGDVNFTDGDYTSGRVYDSGPSYLKQPLVNTTGYAALYLSASYWGYMSIPIDQFDDMTYIRSASLEFYAYGLTMGSGNALVKLMMIDPRYEGASVIWEHIDNTYQLGSVRIQYDFYQYYTVDFDAKALDILRDRIARDETYLAIGFQYQDASAIVYQRYSNLHSYVSIQYDGSPPQVPVPVALDPFVTGSTVSLSWSTSSDLPVGGNVGGVEYQVGIYLPEAPVDNPYHSSPWVDATSWNFTGAVEGIDYTFRVRARDGSGFESNWSTPVNTTMDNSPPATPLLYPEPPYTKGWNNTIIWWPCLDAGVGNVSYEYQFSKEAGFPVNIRHFTNETFVNITDLHGTYYYRVRSLDGLGHTSPWSPIERSTQDSTPPILPMVMEEPALTPGTTNVFNWHSTWDTGIGGVIYYYQIATSPTFAPETIVDEYPTALTTIGIGGLVDGQTYYFRVAAIDGFGHRSEWSAFTSSTQDASPPSAPFVHPLPEYVPEGPITISWSPSEDGGVGVARYEVFWDRPGFPGPPVFLVQVIGQSLTLPYLGGGNWTFSVRAVDGFGHPGPWSEVSTTVDVTPPTAPVLEDVPEFTNGTFITLRWSPSTDDTGVSHYEVSCFPEGWPEAVWLIETNRTWATFPGLADGEAYWYSVRAYDVVGNYADDRWWHSTVDTSPPSVPVVALPRYFTSEIVHISWQESLDKMEGMNSGIGAVQYRVYWDVVRTDGGTDNDLSGDSGWIDATFFDVDGLSGGREWWFEVRARDGLGHVSASSDTVTTTIVTFPPVVMISNPFDMATLSGVVNVMGNCYKGTEDAYFTIEVWVPDENSWLPMIPVLTETEPYGFIFQLDTTRFPDGSYVLRVTVMDELGQEGTSQINVTLANARISVSPNDIVLTDWDPDGGDPPILMVVVHNHGDSAAENLTVQVYEDGVLLERIDGVSIDANSYVDLYYDLDDPGRRTITVKVTSELYATDDVHQTLFVEEDEGGTSSVSDSATWIGVLAIVLAVIAIALNLVGRMRTPAPEERDDENTQNKVADGWEETPREER